MNRSSMRKGTMREMAAVFFFFLAAIASRAQQPPPESRNPDAPSAPQPSGSANPGDVGKTAQGANQNDPFAPGVHRFWDKENDLLFGAVGAGRALDYASTLNLRRRGINEVFLTNAIVDNHAEFAVIEAAATATSIGVSYLFHRTGHHRLERWTSAIHAGVAVGGAIRNYALKTPHPG